MRTILITGATRGLGRALTEEFIRQGHAVFGCGTSAKAIEALQGRHAAPHDFQTVDVTDDAAVRSWAERLLRERGTPDLLLNNAAIINRSAPLWELSAEEFDRVIDVNIKGVTNVLRWFLPAMVERRQGVVVNFSSGWGRSTSPEVVPYCTTKWAMEGLTQGLAEELPAGMAAVPVNPGIINTEMLRSCFGSSAESYPTADEWAKTAVPFFLKLGARDNGRPLTVG